MAFRISEMNTETPKTIWVPIDVSDTCYVGQLVTWTPDDTGDPMVVGSGVGPMIVPVGAGDTTNKLYLLVLLLGQIIGHPYITLPTRPTALQA